MNSGFAGTKLTNVLWRTCDKVISKKNVLKMSNKWAQFNPLYHYQ